MDRAEYERQAREAEEHAENALAVSWIKMKFSPDHLAASMYYNSAATSYASAKCSLDAIRCHERVYDLKHQLSDFQGAGRACEQAAAISETIVDKIGFTLELWSRGAESYRLAGKGDLAVRLLLKSAETCAKHDAHSSKVPEIYDEVLSIQEDADQLYSSPEVFRAYQTFLLHTRQHDAMFAVMERHITVLKALNQLHFVYRELLSKVLILCCDLQEVARATDAINEGIEIDGWIASNEFRAAQDFIDCIENHDAKKLDDMKKRFQSGGLHIDMNVLRMMSNFQISAADDERDDLC